MGSVFEEANVQAHHAIAAALQLARNEQNVSASRELSLVVTKLEEAEHWHKRHTERSANVPTP